MIRTVSRNTPASLAVCMLLSLSSVTIAAGQDNNHRDAFVPGGPDESHLIQQVRHALLMLPYYGVFDDLAFKVDGSTVTLLGAVTRPTLKSDAESAVRHAEGVSQVVNQIEVLPLSPDNDRIRMAVYRAIYGDPSLSMRYGYQAVPSIHIIVKNGNTTLEGVVANKADSDLAYMRASSVPGVFSVTNNLQVESNLSAGKKK